MATSSAASLNFDQRPSNTGDPSNELHLVDRMNAKSDIRKYFALRVNEDDKVVDHLFIILFIYFIIIKSRIQLFQCPTITLRLGIP